MKARRREAGYLLLEVLIAISVLAIGAASSTRVFGQSLQAHKRLGEISLGRTASEALLFRIASGGMPELWTKGGTTQSGPVSLTGESEKNLNYEIISQRFGSSTRDFWITVKITRTDGREIYQTQALLRNEN